METSAKRFRIRQAAYATGCLFLAIVLSWVGRGNGTGVELRTVRVDERPRSLRLQVYLPNRNGRPLPAAVICPPLTVPARMLRPMAMEFAGAGVVCAVLDFHGEKPDENRQRLNMGAVRVATIDMQNAVAFLRGMPEIDPLRIAVVGYSFGGVAALDTARQDKKLRATVLIGIGGDFSPAAPANTLLIAGLYDELHPAGELLGCLQAGVEAEHVEIGVQYGDFSRGTARKLAIISTATHLSEPIHPGLIADVTDWLQGALGAKGRTTGVSYGLAMWAQWGALAASLLLLHLLLGCLGARRSVFRAMAFGFVLLGYAWSVSSLWPTVPRIGLVFVAVPILFAGRARGKMEQGAARQPGKLALNALALYAAYCMTLIVNNFGNYWRTPQLALWVPMFPFVNVIVVAYGVMRLVFIWEHHLGLASLHAVGGALCLVEIARPGCLLGLPAALTRRWPQRQGKGAVRNTRSKIILALLLIVLASVGWRRFQEGMLSRESLHAVGCVVLRLALPMLVFFMLIRRILRAVSGRAR